MNPQTYVDPKLDMSISTNQEQQSLDTDLDSELDELTSSDELDWLKEGTQSLLAFFDQDPEANKYIEKIFSSHLDHSSLDKTTDINLYNALSLYLGEKNTEFILDVINKSLENTNILTHLKTRDFQVWKLICILFSLYGQKFQNYRNQDAPNSWRLIFPTIGYAYISNELLISINIEKYNGENTLYEESPSSFIQFISIMLRILKQVPIKYIDEIDEEMIDELRTEYEEFAELIVS
jgi:hypothetical protein